MKVFKVICALFILGFVSVSHAAVIFITEKDANGVTSLLGADNVEVNNKFYNVRFVDGTCIMLFNGCDASDDFLFNTLDSAIAASDSLLLQVFNGDSLFDLGPSLTNGCSDDTLCGVFTVQSIKRKFAPIIGVLLRNYASGPSVDFHQNGVPGRTWEDTSSNNKLVYAVWSGPVEASAPGTAMVLLMGIAGLIVSQRRKQA
jgi:hypothetical protein